MSISAAEGQGSVRLNSRRRPTGIWEREGSGVRQYVWDADGRSLQLMEAEDIAAEGRLRSPFSVRRAVRQVKQVWPRVEVPARCVFARCVFASPATPHPELSNTLFSRV